MTVAAEIHKSRWTGERIARLGFLLGLGWDAKRIAEDPIIAYPNNVHRQAQRFGLAFRAAAAAMSLRLPAEAAACFEAAAAKRSRVPCSESISAIWPNCAASRFRRFSGWRRVTG
jgi:hypothetical protein